MVQITGTGGVMLHKNPCLVRIWFLKSQYILIKNNKYKYALEMFVILLDLKTFFPLNSFIIVPEIN